jgi:hypothetical protein
VPTDIAGRGGYLAGPSPRGTIPHDKRTVVFEMRTSTYVLAALLILALVV